MNNDKYISAQCPFVSLVAPADQVIIASLFDEWLKDSKCLNCKDTWEASVNQPFPYETILGLLKRRGMEDIGDLGELMADEVITRINGIMASSELCPGCLLLAVIFLNVKRGHKNQWACLAKANVMAHGLSPEDAEIILRGASLCRKVYRGEWPFEYDISTHEFDKGL